MRTCRHLTNNRVLAGRRGSRPLRGIFWGNQLTFLLSLTSTMYETATKPLCRGGPLCPPVLPDMFAVMDFVTAGRRGSRPLRGIVLHALLARAVGYVGCNGIRYRGSAWQPAPTRKCFKNISISVFLASIDFMTDTKLPSISPSNPSPKFNVYQPHIPCRI